MPAVPHVKPFSVMTPREKAEHIVHDHGFDAEWFSLNRAADLPDDNAVVEAFLAVQPWHDAAEADGNSYPHPAGRDGWHEGEHGTVESPGDHIYGGAWAHKHSPESPLARIPAHLRAHHEES